MKGKILFGLITLAVALVSLPLLSAFEAHVINVTAQIENSCLNRIDDVEFGTVFPQEDLDRTIDVSLSESFIQNDVMDVLEYEIRQQPKCWNGDSENALFGVVEDVDGEFVCADEGFTMLPVLCPYLSKEEITDDGDEIENDGDPVLAFHGLPGPWTPITSTTTKAFGRLIDSAGDQADIWNIDLKAPCFSEHCAQDWEDFVHGVNPDVDPDDYIQPFELEGELYGCDLIVQVTDKPTICDQQLDLMFVLDRSGSIDAGELTIIKDAANAFVSALAPGFDVVHVGQTSFSTSGTLDLHLTGVEADVHTAINAVTTGGLTNLSAGISLATAELDNAHEHERPLVPDAMVIITDGLPTRPLGTAQADATAAANAARAAGIEVFVVGVGVSPTTEAYLKANIADDLGHYYAAADFADLETILIGLPICPEVAPVI